MKNWEMKIFLTVFCFILFGLLYVVKATAAEFQFWYGNTGRTGEAIQSLCGDFNKSQDEHSVKCVGQGGYESAMQKAIAAYRAKKHPAIIQFFEAGTLDVLMSGAMVPVSEVIWKAGYQVDWSDYLTAATNYYATDDGRLHALPFNVSTLVFYVNDDKLHSAGVEKVPSTWEEFEQVLIKLKEFGEYCPFAYQLHPWWHLEQFSSIHGVPIASLENGYEGLEPEYVFHETLHLRMMNDLKKWHDNDLALPPHKLASGNIASAFAGGDCALLVTSTGSFSAIRQGSQSNNFNFSIHPVPHYESVKSHNTLIGGAALWVMHGFDDSIYKGVAAFLDYISKPETQLGFTKLTGFLPVTNSARKLINELDQQDLPAFGSVNVGMTSLDKEGNQYTKGIRLGSYVRFRSIWIEELEKAFNNKISIEEALLRAKRRGDKLLKRFRRVYEGEEMP